MRRFQFEKNTDDDFVRVLYKRVDAYFNESQLSKNANDSMIAKSIFLFGLYVAVYLVILLSGSENFPLLFSCWALLGVLQSFIGMTIMHDAVHGAYSSNKWAMALLEIPIISIGVESAIWKIEHNYIHHNYPNIDGIDQDIHPRFLFRFSKHQPRRWFHQFQQYYAVLLYSLLVLEWTSIKDFLKVLKYYDQGFIKSKGEALKTALIILIKKSVFFGLFLIIPLVYLQFEWYWVIAMFLTMAMVAGVVMTTTFQTAHVVPECDSISSEKNQLPVSWHMHQLLTTANFAKDNKFVTFLLGGLNYQIEHHLFPGICHVHYPEIARIVKSTAEEYAMPYHENTSFWSAIRGHFALLKRLGQA